MINPTTDMNDAADADMTAEEAVDLLEFAVSYLNRFIQDAPDDTPLITLQVVKDTLKNHVTYIEETIEVIRENSELKTYTRLLNSESCNTYTDQAALEDLNMAAQMLSRVSQHCPDDLLGEERAAQLYKDGLKKHSRYISDQCEYDQTSQKPHDTSSSPSHSLK